MAERIAKRPKNKMESLPERGLSAWTSPTKVQSWHREPCKYPDVVHQGGILFCSGCESSTSLLTTTTTQEELFPTPPTEPEAFTRDLRWPASVSFWDSSSLELQGSPPTDHAKSWIRPRDDQANEGSEVVRTDQALHPSIPGRTQFRLLRLSKGRPDDPIHATFLLADLARPPLFQALSYTWSNGPRRDSPCLIMYLGRRWDPFAITANCHAALRRLRQHKEDLIVWVDAICIDQANIAERNRQVNMMQRIYNTASEVSVYLGEMLDGDEEAMDRLRWAVQTQSIDAKGRECLRHFFEKPYFHRVWVIPEVSNARSALIYCGNQTMGWSIFNEARLKRLGVLDIVPPWVWTTYNTADQTVADLTHILISTASANASDARDKIFAIFGLISDATENGLVPNYTLTLQEVYIGISAFLVTHHGLDVLEYAGRSHGKPTSNFPSWVVNWNAQMRRQWQPQGQGKEYLTLKDQHVSLTLQASNTTQLRHTHMTCGNGELRLQGCWLYSHLLRKSSDLESDLMIVGPGWEVEKNLVSNNKQIRIAVPDAMHVGKDYELMLFEGSDKIFVVANRDENSGSTSSGSSKMTRCELIGVCYISIPTGVSDHIEQMRYPDRDLTTVLRYLREHCALSRAEIHKLIEAERILKLLGHWAPQSDADSTSNYQTGFQESEVTEAEIEIAIERYLFCRSDDPQWLMDESDAKISAKVEWLASRLLLWEGVDLWTRISSIRGFSLDWGSWRSDKYTLLCDIAYHPRLNEAVVPFMHTLPRLVKMLLKICPILTERECRVRIGNASIELCLDSPIFEGAIRDAVLKLREEHGSYDSHDWWFYEDKCDWSELETLLLAVETLKGSEYESLRDLYRRRRLLRALQPRTRTWETFVLI